MVLTILRILILYVLATAAVRIMGKRQKGELQPYSLSPGLAPGKVYIPKSVESPKPAQL